MLKIFEKKHFIILIAAFSTAIIILLLSLISQKFLIEDEKKQPSSEKFSNRPRIITVPEVQLPPIDHWKTYRNKYGYEIKYPADWVAFDSTESVKIKNILNEYNITPNYDQRHFFGAPNLLQISVLKENLEIYLETLTHSIKQEDIILNNYKAKKITLLNNTYPSLYVFEKNDKLIIININVAIGYDTGITETHANKIIATLKFFE